MTRFNITQQQQQQHLKSALAGHQVHKPRVGRQEHLRFVGKEAVAVRRREEVEEEEEEVISGSNRGGKRAAYSVIRRPFMTLILKMIPPCRAVSSTQRGARTLQHTGA